MRFRVGRHLGVAALYLLAHLGLGGCSSQQQQGEDVEAGEQGEQGAEEGQEQANNAEGEQGENTAENEGNEINNGEEVVNEEGGQEAGSQEEGGETTTAEGGSNESDLQEIISDMNGQPAEGGNNAALANGQGTPANGATNTSANPAIVSDSAQTTPATTAPQAVASGPAAGPALPEMGAKMPYIVQRGDTLAKISTKIYGSMDKWKEISSLTGLANPSRIYPGDVVYYTLDQQSQAFAQAYESVQRASTQVQQGDTLARIAKRVYGSSASWKSIWRQNDTINNPDKLEAGMTVYYIQAGALSAAVKEARAKVGAVAQNIQKALDSSANTTISVESVNVFSTVSANANSITTLATVNMGVLG